MTTLVEKPGFDFVRISKSKKVVDLHPIFIRKLAKRGLPLYRTGANCVWFRLSELEDFITKGN